MLSYLVFTVILVSVNGYVSHSMYEASMRKQTRSNIQETLKQINDNVAYKTDDMVRISSIIYKDYAFVEDLRAQLNSPKLINDRMTKQIMPKLDNASKSIGLNLRLSVYFENETIDEKYYNHLEETNAQSVYMYHLKRIKSEAWYQTLPIEKYNETMVWKQVEEDRSQNRISMIRRIVDLDMTHSGITDPEPQELGVMRFSVQKDELFESVDFTKLGPGSKIVIRDRNGNLIFTSSLPEKKVHISEVSKGNNNTVDPFSSGEYLTIEEEMLQQDWTIVAHIPLNVIEQEASKVRNLIIFICVIGFVLFTFAGVFISRYFSKRITKFVSVLNAFREGDLHKRISYRGKDEFSQIATALNGMGEDFEALINKVYLTQLQKKEAELEMLQTQINPHFLYNTLSSINRLAKFGENEKLQKMVVELAKFYRLTLNSGRTLIPVYSEIEQSNAYLEIQKVKYGHRLEVTFDVDAEIWKYETVKLIIQPFIENALKHAWSGDRIHIKIVAHKEGDTILYRIIDDGLGVRQERIEEIMIATNESETGFGIRNIHQRVQLQYGSEYGVSIYSRMGIGTSVNIRIPARKRKLFMHDQTLVE